MFPVGRKHDWEPEQMCTDRRLLATFTTVRPRACSFVNETQQLAKYAILFLSPLITFKSNYMIKQNHKIMYFKFLLKEDPFPTSLHQLAAPITSFPFNAAMFHTAHGLAA